MSKYPLPVDVVLLVTTFSQLKARPLPLFEAAFALVVQFAVLRVSSGLLIPV